MWDEGDLATDVSAGLWITELRHDPRSLRPRGTVGALVPPVFQAYARIPHPAYRIFTVPSIYMGREIVRREYEPVRWEYIARANGRVAHPLMEWEKIVGVNRNTSGGEHTWDDAPWTGSLDVNYVRELAEILEGYTGTPESCWFAIWDGNTALYEFRGIGGRLSVDGFDHILISDSVRAAVKNLNNRAPNFWWPEDRAWFVVSHPDLPSTLVGGTKECISAITSDPHLEAYEVDVSSSVIWGGDKVNPSSAEPASE